MTRQILFSEENSLKYLASKRVRNTLGKRYGKEVGEKNYNTHSL